MALTKFCNKQGCHNLCPITDRYCADHTHLIAESEAERQKRYDQTVRHTRDAEYTAFYHTPEWEAKRIYIIAKYKGLDVYAYYIKHKAVPATMVHHIIELKTDWNLRLSDSNLIPMSAKSHSEMDRLYKTDKRKTQVLLLGLLKKWAEEHGLTRKV